MTADHFVFQFQPSPTAAFPVKAATWTGEYSLARSGAAWAPVEVRSVRKVPGEICTVEGFTGDITLGTCFEVMIATPLEAGFVRTTAHSAIGELSAPSNAVAVPEPSMGAFWALFVFLLLVIAVDKPGPRGRTQR